MYATSIEMVYDALVRSDRDCSEIETRRLLRKNLSAGIVSDRKI